MIPIRTVIRNNTSTGKTIHWAGKDTKWLPPHGETVVPFEVWSVANSAQREAIKFALVNRSVALSLQVLGSDGNYITVDFNPFGCVKPQVVSEHGVLDLNTTKKQVAEIDHTVRITSTETANVMSAYGAQKVAVNGDDEILPTRELKNGEPEKVEPEKEATVEESKEEQPKEEQTAEPKKRRTKKAE